MCAFYRQIPVGRVEAGLRSFDRLAPFLEPAGAANLRALQQER